MNMLEKVGLFLVYLLSAVWAIKTFSEPDLWWMLRTGEYILQNGVPYTDPFSYTRFGQPWINVKWGFEVIAYLWAQVFQPEGLLLLQLICNLAMLSILRALWLLLSPKEDKPSYFTFYLVAVIAFAASEFRMTSRPEMVSHLLSLLFIYLHVRFYTSGYKNVKLMYVMFALQVLWANLHEAFGVGMVLHVVFLSSALLMHYVHEKIEIKLLIRYGLLALLCLLAPAFHPYGPKMILHPIEIFSQLSANKYTVELFDFRQPLYWGISTYLGLGIMLFLILGLFLAWMKFKKESPLRLMVWLSPGYLLVLAMFFYLALSAQRNIPFFALAAVPAASLALTGLSTISWINRIFTINIWKYVLLAGIMFLYGTIASNKWYESFSLKDSFGLGIDPLRNSSGAIQFIKQNQIKGKAFSDYLNSSALMWGLRPDFKTFIDLRDLDVFPQTFFNKYLDVVNDPMKFIALDSVEQFDYVVLSRIDFPALHEFLNRERYFEMVYVDPSDAVYVREIDDNLELLKKHAFMDGKRDLFNLNRVSKTHWVHRVNYIFWPFYRPHYYDKMDIDEQAATYYHTIMHYDMCVERANRSLARNPRNINLHLLVGSTFLSWSNYTRSPDERTKRLSLASQAYQSALSIEPENITALQGMAYFHIQIGYPDIAKDYLDIALKKEPDQPYSLLYYAESRKQKANMDTLNRLRYLQDAFDLVDRARMRKPEEAEIVWVLADLYKAKGNCAEAEQLILNSTSIKADGYRNNRLEYLLSDCPGRKPANSLLPR